MEKARLKSFLTDYRTLLGLWILLGVLATVMKYHSDNNFLIFRGVFWHTWQGTSLYAAYPQEYFDVNHYGPFFSVLIAPFAVVPEWLGLLLWCVGLSLFLYVAVRHNRFTDYQQLFILWFCAHELLTALYMQQFNIAIAAIILLTWYCIERERDFMAAFWIMLGTFVKLYGIVGLAFFFFSRTEKNGENLASIAQNISLLGLVHRTTGLQFSDLWLIVPGLILFALPYLRFSQYRHEAFRQTLLASVLMFVVLFSTGSESSGYIIALVGVVIWYTACPWQRTRWDIFLMVFVFILSSLSPSDLFPAFLRKEYVQPYALKALPVVLVWFQLCYEMLTKDYSKTS